MIDQIKEIIRKSDILAQDDSKWPRPDKTGTQELEIIGYNEEMKCFDVLDEYYYNSRETEIQKSDDPKGLEVFYYLTQDIKSLVFTLIKMHFRVKPVQN